MIARSSGAIRWIALHGHESREPGHLVGTVTDITDRKAAEEARARLEDILGSMQDAFLTVTPEGIITSWNPAAERLLGWTAHEMVGQPLMRLVPEDLRAEAVAKRHRHLSGRGETAYDTRRLHKDGSEIEVSIMVSATRDPSVNIIGLSGVLTMVCYAMWVARTAPERIPARTRIPTYAVWETAVFALNVLAFIFIGLQVRPILDRTYPLGEVAAAIRDVRDGKARGKVVVTV